MSAVVGYARTSTADQQAGLDAQIAELQAAGCSRIFSEQVSGADTARPELQAALDWVRAGDVFVVTKPDRLARNVMDLLGIVERLKAKEVTVRILAMHLDTGNPTSNLILTILAGVGSWEREIMLERQRAGIAKAKAEGKYKGRAPTARLKADEVRRLKAEGMSVADIVKATGISRASVYRAFSEAA
ncbi:recombinase family protein [Brevundimonas sp. BH3]|jgi:DNA invertase Pin-like site-specific DNA recombinase|uniref:recombinase family protein n=1 Tax=Brevundimonas sp. BH3 TaxID=3133089 RepID=UPI00324BA6D2